MPCSIEELIYDEACVVLKSGSASTSWLYSLSSDCEACPFERIAHIQSEGESVKFKTARSVLWRVLKDGESKYASPSNMSGVVCELSPNLGQFGLYEFTVNNTRCDLDTINEPTSSYIPLIIVLAVLVCLIAAWRVLGYGIVFIQKRIQRRTTVISDTRVEKASAKPRVGSIDTFRGLCILFMIFVNDGAGGYYFLEHATWNGLLVGDVVFPAFMWIMGFCIPISLSSHLSRGASRSSICKGIVKRSIMLFLIGVSLNTVGTNAQLGQIRIFGVLQRFGVAYLTVGTMFTMLSPRKTIESKNSIFRKNSDILVLLPQWLVILCTVAAHEAIVFLLPVPGCPTGYIGPGGIHEGGKYFNCTGGATGYIDKLILGQDHVYQWPTAREVYKSESFDPEGILGCLNSIFHVFLGVQAGMIIKHHANWKSRVVRWLSWAVICGGVGCALHFSGAIPMNKNLWSLSFSLVNVCIAMVIFVGFYLLMDVSRIWKGGPFKAPGMNALLMYTGHEMCYQIFPFHWRYGSMGTHAWVLVETIWGVSLWVLIAYTLHRKRTYFSL